MTERWKSLTSFQVLRGSKTGEFRKTPYESCKRDKVGEGTKPSKIVLLIRT